MELFFIWMRLEHNHLFHREVISLQQEELEFNITSRILHLQVILQIVTHYQVRHQQILHLKHKHQQILQQPLLH